MKKFFLFPIIILAIVVIVFFVVMDNKKAEAPGVGTSPVADKKYILIENRKIVLEIADTDAERTLGLSNRSSMPLDSALLFAFDEPNTWGIWMKDMQFAIDIFWLDSNFKIVGLKKNALPESYPEVFKSQVPATYVLETRVGFADNFGVNVGDVFDLR